jgi:hypothetical protein
VSATKWLQHALECGHTASIRAARAAQQSRSSSNEFAQIAPLQEHHPNAPGHTRLRCADTIGLPLIARRHRGNLWLSAAMISGRANPRRVRIRRTASASVFVFGSQALRKRSSSARYTDRAMQGSVAPTRRLVTRSLRNLHGPSRRSGTQTSRELRSPEAVAMCAQGETPLGRARCRGAAGARMPDKRSRNEARGARAQRRGDERSPTPNRRRDTRSGRRAAFPRLCASPGARRAKTRSCCRSQGPDR